MDLRKHMIAGNWKMNGTLDSISEILKIDKWARKKTEELSIKYENYL